MMLYKLICVVVLCFVFDGAAVVAGDKCDYGVCTPLRRCQSAQFSHSLLNAIPLCNSRGKEILVCCYDKVASISPLVTNFIYVFNLANTFPRHNPFNRIPPQWPTAITARQGWPTSSTGYRRTTTSTTTTAEPVATTPRPHPVGTNTPQWPTSSTSSADYRPHPVDTNPPQWPTSSTSSVSYRPYPVDTNRPELPITSTNTSGYVSHPVSTIRPPQWSTASTAHHGWPTSSTTHRPTTTSTTTTEKPVATTPPPRPTTTEYMPPVYDYVARESVFEGCRELDPKLTTYKIGRPAWDKCIDYQQLVYPCQRSVALLGNMVRVNNCAHAEPNTDKIARSDEFPHVVVLGVRRRSEKSLRWACTGTLISERFILSSAYCWRRKNSNDQIYAALGVHQRMVGNTEAYQEHGIESTILYDPRYNGHIKDHRYHDIALLKTATEIRLNQWVIPACLNVFGDNTLSGVSTRWRARSWNSTNTLQKEFLHHLSRDVYQNKFPGMKYKVANQMGYGSYETSYDNCQFDNEGSLIVENHLVHCMYTVVGVLSSVANPTCGRLPSGSYTRIANYTLWIEQIVWPYENKVVWGS